MPVHVVADRVQETTTTTGTGPIALAGALTQCQSFISTVGNGNECDYLILSGNGTDWESGRGFIHTGTPPTLTRDSVVTSTNGGAAISLTGTSTVFLAATAGRIYGRLGRRPTRPALSTFAWVNQQSSAATDYNNGPITQSVPPMNGDELCALVQPTTVAPWTCTVEIEALGFNGTAFGLVLFDTAGKAVSLGAQFNLSGTGNGTSWNVYHWNSTSSQNATKFTIPLLPTPRYWFRIYHDGTNLNFLISVNGADWITIGAEPVTSFLGTLSTIGFFSESNTTLSVPNSQISIWSFELVSGTGSNVQWV